MTSSEIVPAHGEAPARPDAALRIASLAGADGSPAAGAARVPSQGAAPAPPFDPRELEPRFSLFGWFPEWIQRHPALVWGTLNRLLRTPRVFAWSFVLRMDDVREVLNHDAEFPVMWGERMKRNTDNLNFVLGMPRDDAYRKRYKELAQAFPLEDVAPRVARQAAREAEQIVSASGGQLDGVRDLVTEVPSRLCRTYYGLDVQDTRIFAQCTLAVSSFTFGPGKDKAIEALAVPAARYLTETIDRSIAAAHAAGKVDPSAPVIGRMIAAGLPDREIHAHLFGMVLGFIPTDVLAGGNMLEVLLRHPPFLEQARAAARADDDELLWKCLREALRFRHINLGAWRGIPEDYRLCGGAGGSLIRGGARRRVLAVIPSAMFDARRVKRPSVFDPHRPEEDYMIFGVGQHWCLGAYIAKAQITQTFKPLLKRDGLCADDRRVRTQRFNGLFPLHLRIHFQP
jgi:cytochrome P450